MSVHAWVSLCVCVPKHCHFCQHQISKKQMKEFYPILVTCVFAFIYMQIWGQKVKGQGHRRRRYNCRRQPVEFCLVYSQFFMRIVSLAIRPIILGNCCLAITKPLVNVVSCHRVKGAVPTSTAAKLWEKTFLWIIFSSVNQLLVLNSYCRIMMTIVHRSDLPKPCHASSASLSQVHFL